jgi:hypothetical protein
MEDIKNLVGSLLCSHEKGEKVRIMQEVNRLLVSEYMLRIKNVCIYPTEVESYYFGDSFEDKHTHDAKKHNRLQRNRFGKLYFHNSLLSYIGKSKRGGVDICLSDSEEYAYSVLIRSAYINGEADLVMGPNKIAKYIVRECGTDLDVDQNVLLPKDMNGDRRDSTLVFHSRRYGLSHCDGYTCLPLRTLIELKGHKYPQKEQVVRDYLQQYRDDNDKYNEVSKELLGYIIRA